MAVTKTYVVDKFNEIVITSPPLPAFNSAPWHAGSPPAGYSGSDLGSQTENMLSVGEIPGEVLATSIFNILHNFAQKLTRVHKARFVFGRSVGSTNATTQTYNIAAFNDFYTLHFPLPIPQPQPGEGVIGAALDAFLTQLRTEVQNRRDNPSGMAQTIYACHSSCHSSCHGSRGRR